MGKSPQRSGKTWSAKEVSSLKTLAQGNTPTRVIALKLGRTPEAIKSKVSDIGQSLKPTNQSPYNRRRAK